MKGIKNRIFEILNLYKDNPGSELEIKVYLPTNDDFINKLNEYAGIAEGYHFEHSVSFISKDFRKESFYENGEKKYHDFLKKTSIVNPIKTNKYKITLMAENKIKEVKKIWKFARIKTRCSIIGVPGFEGWRLDFTIVNTIRELRSLPTLINNRKYASNLEDFSELIPAENNGNYSCEFEIECVDGCDNINQILNNFDVNKPGSKLLSVIGRKMSVNNTVFNLKQLMNNPIQLDKSEYSKLISNLPNYYISDKADGERCFITIINGTSRLVTSNDDYPCPVTHKKELILDAELLGPPENPDIVLVFDIMYYGINVMNKSYTERLEILDSIKLPTNYQLKSCVKLSDYKKQIKEFISEEKIYPTDGLIFTEDAKYNSTVYKWKPEDKLTIDFLIIDTPKELLGKNPYISKPGNNIYLLFCGISYNVFNKLGLELLPYYDKMIKHNKKNNYFPIHFTPGGNKFAYIWTTKEKDLGCKVGEFGYDVDKEEWILHKIRHDKQSQVQQGVAFGNDFTVAEDIYHIIQDPLTLGNLTGDVEIDLGYFKKSKTVEGKYFSMIKFNSFVKAQVLRQLSGTEFVVDLASGKGQDMSTYFSFGVKKVLFVDVDKSAIKELNKRKFNLDQDKFHIYGKPPVKHSMKIDTLVADISKEDIESEHASGVVINLAIHYLINDDISKDNFINKVDKILNPGGTFIFTCFNYDNVMPLIKDGDFIMEEDGEIKYHIKLVKEGPVPVISVKHPFSEEMMEEYLIDINWVLEGFINKGYIVIQNSTFADWLYKFEKFNPSLYGKMSDEDKLYSSLYSYVSLIKP